MFLSAVRLNFYKMEIEQRCVIHFLYLKGLSGKDIKAELNNVYGDQAMSKTQVYFWISEFHRGRNDLNDLIRPGRPKDDIIDVLIQNQLDNDPHASARIIAKRIGYSLHAVLDHLHTVFCMKNYHLKWVPHFLNETQKKARVTCSKNLLEILNDCSANNYKYIITGDESYFEYYYSRERMWAFSKGDIDEKLEQSHFQRKTMFTIFFNGDGIQLIDMKPKGIRINADYFLNNIIKTLELTDIVTEATRNDENVFIHYDNAPCHNACAVKTYLPQSRFTRVDHPPFSPDIAPCDFALFGSIKESFNDAVFETEEELLDAILNFFDTKGPEYFISIFKSWEERLRLVIKNKGGYI